LIPFKELSVKTIQTIPLFIATVALLVACSSAESDWKKADAANTTAAYEDFLKQHPNDTHAQEARDRMQKMEDEEAWSDAQKSNTLEAYQQYLQKEPSGKHVTDSHTQVTALERAAAWKTAQAANTEAALQDFLRKYSQGPEVDQAHTQLQKLQSEGYRVQLATSRDQKAAEKSRSSLQTRFNGELHDVVVIPPTGSDKLYRIASGPMTEADAKSACTTLKKVHQHCEVVKG
jgi:outer membrane protein assembly factor BamD (BamD/ComL family)